jgi:hypothetical protein
LWSVFIAKQTPYGLQLCLQLHQLCFFPLGCCQLRAQTAHPKLPHLNNDNNEIKHKNANIKNTNRINVPITCQQIIDSGL